MTTDPNDPMLQMNFMEQYMHARRELDKRRNPHATDTNSVRHAMGSIVRMLIIEKLGREQVKQAIKTDFEGVYTKYPKLVEMCLTIDNEDQARDFFVVLEQMLSQIENVQKGRASIEESSDNVEMFLGKKYVKPREQTR